MVEEIKSKVSPEDATRFVMIQNDLQKYTSDLQGRLLTIIDASLSDKTQREAIKSLIKKELWSDQGMLINWTVSLTANDEIRNLMPV